MSAWLYIAAFLASGTGKPALKVPVPRPSLAASVPLPLAVADFTLNISPATVSFTAADPDSPLVAGSSTTTITWLAKSDKDSPMSLELYSAATTFTNCPDVPISAVIVTCQSALIGGGSGTASCGAVSPLSTTRTTVASGAQSAGNRSYSVTLSYTLTDQWKYIARTSPQCTLNITYIATLN